MNVKFVIIITFIYKNEAHPINFYKEWKTNLRRDLGFLAQRLYHIQKYTILIIFHLKCIHYKIIN
jgi:hypothetical protein